MLLDKKELLNKLNVLKKSINIFNENINKIIEILNNLKEKVGIIEKCWLKLKQRRLMRKNKNDKYEEYSM